MGETNISIQTHLVSPSLSELSFTNINHLISNGHLNHMHTGLHVQFTTPWALCTVAVVQSLSRVWLFATPWTAAHQVSLSFSISRHVFLEFAQTHHWVSGAIQPSHPLLPSSPPAFSLSQHQSLFQWIGSLHKMAKVSQLQLQHQFFQWIFRVCLLYEWLVWSSCCPRDSQESSAPQFRSINSLALSLLYGPTLTSVHDYWKECLLAPPMCPQLRIKRQSKYIQSWRHKPMTQSWPPQTPPASLSAVCSVFFQPRSTKRLTRWLDHTGSQELRTAPRCPTQRPWSMRSRDLQISCPWASPIMSSGTLISEATFCPRWSCTSALIPASSCTPLYPHSSWFPTVLHTPTLISPNWAHLHPRVQTSFLFSALSSKTPNTSATQMPSIHNTSWMSRATSRRMKPLCLFPLVGVYGLSPPTLNSSAETC